MKQIIFLACLIISTCKLFANDTLIFRISNPWRSAKDMNGIYVRKVIQTADSGFLAFDYSQSGLVAKGYYSDTDFNIKIYCHYFYNPNKGFPMEIKYYDSVGNLILHAELNKNADTIWRQTFKDDVMISSKVFPEHDSDRTIFFSMQKPAVYPGGYPNWKKFIAANMRHPKEGGKKKAQGTVMVEFTVSPEGKVASPKVIQSAGPLLDTEALRLIRLSPNWMPAEENGNKISFVQRQSIVFK